MRVGNRGTCLPRVVGGPAAAVPVVFAHALGADLSPNVEPPAVFSAALTTLLHAHP